MSNKNNHTKSKVVAGAALVALSGFVPQPFMQQAYADTATITVTGKFISGITLTAGADVKMGSIVATANTGNVTVNPAGGTAVNKGTFVGGTQSNGTINIKAAATQPIDITVAGLGAINLTGVGATGTATLTKVFIDGPITAPATFTGAVASTTATATGIPLKASAVLNTTKDLAIGARVSWTGGRPQGGFSEAIVVTVHY